MLPKVVEDTRLNIYQLACDLVVADGELLALGFLVLSLLPHPDIILIHTAVIYGQLYQ